MARRVLATTCLSALLGACLPLSPLTGPSVPSESACRSPRLSSCLYPWAFVSSTRLSVLAACSTLALSTRLSALSGLSVLSVCLPLLTRRTMALGEVEETRGEVEETRDVLGSDGFLFREETRTTGASRSLFPRRPSLFSRWEENRITHIKNPFQTGTRFRVLQYVQ